jgi:hypothetical protein
LKNVLQNAIASSLGLGVSQVTIRSVAVVGAARRGLLSDSGRALASTSVNVDYTISSVNGPSASTLVQSLNSAVASGSLSKNIVSSAAQANMPSLINISASAPPVTLDLSPSSAPSSAPSVPRAVPTLSAEGAAQSGLSAGIGGAVGGVVAIILLIIFVHRYCKNRTRRNAVIATSVSQDA